MKRKLLNLLMLVVVIVLAIGVYFASQKSAQPPKPPLTPLNAAKIDTISIEKPGHKTLALKRSKGQWRLTAPIKVEANNANVNSILAVATSPCETSIKPSQVTLSDLGLKPAKYSILFNQTRVDIGAIEPLKYRRYAMVDDTICLISNPSAPGLGSENYANLVSTALIPTGKTLVKISLPGHTAVKNAKSGKWSLAPADPKVAKDAAQQLAKAWQQAHAMWNALTPGTAKAPAKPLQVTLSFKDGSQIVYRVASEKPQLKLRRSDIGIDYTVSKAEGGKLLAVAKPKPASGGSTAKPASAATAAVAGRSAR
ncbi:MAG: DUF4340 domain-containing protein [Sinobacteraceae bacterium]|nr:DUF4340 domain-containing protein [Nevskiaceae bacterium]